MIQSLKLLGTRIRQLRKDRGMSVADLARAIGVTEAHVYSLELGRYGPTFARLTEIAHAFGVAIADVVNWPELHIRFQLFDLMRDAPVEVLVEMKEWLLKHLPKRAAPSEAAAKAGRK